MSIHDVIANTPSPRTRATLAADLRRLEVMPGSVLMVHCSLRSLGWVCGAQTAVIQALQDALTPAGTLVMPSHSSDLTDPAQWSQPPVPHEWQRTIRDNMPAYHPQTTPTRGMGAVAEQFRTWPGVLRSAHPAFSLAAAGPHAAELIDPHPLADPFGETSPLARLYLLDASVLLLGVGFDRCTALHLAECRAWPDRPSAIQGAPLMVEGARRWVWYEVPPKEAERFPEIGTLLEQAGLITTGMVGSAACRLVRARNAVDAAVEHWREGVTA